MSVRKSVNALENSRRAINCYIKGGGLVPVYYGEKFSADFPDNAYFAEYSDLVKKIYVYTYDAVYTSDGGYKFDIVNKCYNGDQPLMIDLRYKNAAMQAVIIGDVVYFCSDGGKYDSCVLDYSLSCGVVHCGRLFGADLYDGFTVRWTATDKLFDCEKGLHEMGYLQLDPKRGKVLDMLVFGGKIVAVREYGLTVLNMHGSPENFSVDLTDTDCDGIYKGTCRSIGGKLYFYSASGLKYFDGAKISRIDLKYTVDARCCTDFAGKYFVAGKNDDIGDDVILCINLSDGECCLIREYAEALFASDAVYFGANGTLYRLEDGGEYYFESGAIDFGTGKLKTVTQIDVRGTAEISIGNGSFTRKFSNASGIIRPRMRGTAFTVTAQGKSALDGLTLTAEVTDAV